MIKKSSDNISSWLNSSEWIGGSSLKMKMVNTK